MKGFIMSLLSRPDYRDNPTHFEKYCEWYLLAVLYIPAPLIVIIGLIVGGGE